MKKTRFYLPRRWGEKIILFIVAFLFLLFFSTDFGLIDIQKTAIILAAGIDRTEDGNFSVTAQIAVPEASKSGGAAQATAISGSGETIARAFQEINTKTGWFPKLIFCDLIVLGETITQGNVFDCLSYFMRNEQMSDNCLLAACEGSAQEILTATTPTESMPALALQKILATEAKESGNISTVNLKDFAADYFSEHKSGYMPFLFLLPQTEGAQGGQSGEGGQSGGGAQTAAAAQDNGQSGQSGKDQKSSVFYGACTAVFYDGKLKTVLTREESFALNLVVGKVRQATLQVPLPDGTAYALSLTDVKGKINLQTKDNLPRLKIGLNAVARVSDCTVPKSLENIASTNTVREELLQKAEELLARDLSAVFEKCRENQCDIFGALDRLQKYHTTFYNAYKEDLLARIVPTFEIRVRDSD